MASMMQVLIAILVVYCGNVNGQTGDDETIRLQLARKAFDKINNGCYDFQYSQSCFCSQCFTQSMNIEVSNNEVEQVTFAEGNDFALDHFCGGNEDIFSSVLETSSRTIDDLFDLIQDAINRDLPFQATYHYKIGVPLNIFIDRVPGAIDDEVSYSINCLQFDAKCKANPKMKEKIKTFNNKDVYACCNVHIPYKCPFDRFECNRFYDGCNTCSCDGRDTVGCTKRVCENYTDEVCFDCESNTEWETCGNHCDPTCDDLCNSHSECREPRCQCPASLPIWDGSECVTEDECTPSPIIGEQFCIENCKEYTDGCKTCRCDNDGNAISCDIPQNCEPGFISGATCKECLDPDTMSYTTCGGCTRTCQQYLDNDVFGCIAMCQDKCECNKDTPLYLPEEARCITETECKEIGNVPTDEPVTESKCPEHCAEYFDGCNQCNCNNPTLAACTFKFCPPEQTEEPKCTECEDWETMEWTTCGGCDAMCDDLNPLCTLQCRNKCQCKPDTPIYDAINKKCIKLDECPNIPPNSTETVEVIDYCPTHCVIFYDGCNKCHCKDPKEPICTLGFCPQREEATCESCEDDETMEFTTCGACDRTCDNLNPSCTRQCRIKCQCKEDTPIYDAVNKKCITEDECHNVENQMVGYSLSNTNVGHKETLFVILFVVAIIILFAIWMFNKNKQRGGYQKIDSKKVMPSLHSLTM